MTDFGLFFVWAAQMLQKIFLNFQWCLTVSRRHTLQLHETQLKAGLGSSAVYWLARALQKRSTGHPDRTGHQEDWSKHESASCVAPFSNYVLKSAVFTRPQRMGNDFPLDLSWDRTRDDYVPNQLVSLLNKTNLVKTNSQLDNVETPKHEAGSVAMRYACEIILSASQTNRKRASSLNNSFTSLQLNLLSLFQILIIF